jgi:hypothetical protein
MVIFPTCGRIAIHIIIVVVIFVGCVIILVFLACGTITLGTIMVVVFSTDSAMVVVSPMSCIMGRYCSSSNFFYMWYYRVRCYNGNFSCR